MAEPEVSVVEAPVYEAPVVEESVYEAPVVEAPVAPQKVVDPELLAELESKADVYRKNLEDAKAAMAATWNPAMKQRLQERIDKTTEKLADVTMQINALKG